MPAPLPHSSHHRRRVVVGMLKMAIAAAILAFLVYRLRGEGVFTRLVDEPKHWGRLALAQVLVLVGISLNWVRWQILVRALKLDFSFRDAFRLGALGHLLSQVSLGSVGGDVFKAMVVAREHPGKRTEAVASVIIDRVVGLYALLLVASVGAVAAGESLALDDELRGLMALVLTLAVIGTVGIALLMTPALTGPWLRERLRKIPGVGSTLVRLFGAADAYRHERRYLFAAIGVACCTHLSLVAAIWLIGQGLPIKAPTLAATFLVGPLSLCAGAIPLTPAGLGTFEAAMDQLYQAVGSQQGDGLLAAICYRAMTYVVAGIGATFYVTARKKVREVLEEAEAEEDAAGDAKPSA
ncbi:lysylphosphatidylglycerol synthase transmembrane domain-containing protein [Lacipirellula parvula]|uniref:Flippase-like domain-containing protein n=1 Tax=Lacipirellula parvula TaxID=2650471 RepID=A0A5K7X800_9BACT|nr:lysylphosphatidylglycerol synthase transmembrane domain-containing protein [Lacipirellula parvula]BBO32904.1 hypothetical protein PLANPX_2516 [Lacipirellula parvula]